MPPSLIYHDLNATLYPTNTENETLLVVRFNGPTRISSVRIIPEGVGLGNLGDGVGTTYPTRFTAQLLLNISPSNPVNALASTTLEVVPSEHALDYPVDMPVGVTTRMMMFRSPAQQLSLSVYGYSGDTLNNIDKPSPSPGPTPIPQTPSSTTDFSWLYTWSGPSPSSLFSLLAESVPPQLSDRALDCLSLLAELQSESLLPILLDDTKATKYIMTIPSASATPLKERILSNAKYALHPNISTYLPPDHPLRPLGQATTKQEKHAVAMQNLPVMGLGAMSVLQNMGEDDLLRVEEGEEKSNLIRLVEYGEALVGKDDQESTRCFGKIVEILNRPFSDNMANRYLARRLPRLIVHFNMTAVDKENISKLNVLLEYSQVVLASIVELRSDIIDGKSTKVICDELAEKYLVNLHQNHPLKNVFLAQPARSPISAQEIEAPTADQRRLNRLSNSLVNPHTPTSLVHTLTPSELVSLISPELYKSLSTARQPPFGISPSIQSYEMEQGTKSFAGKVYTHHEFRRDRNDPSSMGMGLGISGMGGMGGLGVGSSAGGGGRAASRHVDSWSGGGGR
ncbi:hypothetical protein I302_106361 [Kwoniella bestiolae CBS 10118]|uniref:Uncharacterized protein n=1 Tax=Kwoniella bestiolae CBS 10118 TaxID=1296100 RepID=A0A1B9G3S6_9TREE|nr:hypothetical protein I302_05485 [Kwoniella bestiolae CBS 10118]OCF25661.1 hypothetical protein I302_05485 [Kwoniella bestiolae CBS 10118]